MGTWSPGATATSGNDVFTGNNTDEIADGLAGNDTLNGNGGADTLTGGDGDDIIRPGDDYVRDVLAGGNNYDILDYSSLTEDGLVAVSSGIYRDVGGNFDGYSGFEEIIGSSASDMIQPSTQNALVMRGGGGNDLLIVNGQTNNPDLYGGVGSDFFFLFAGGPSRIMDFEVGVDRFITGSITSMSISGADTLLTTNVGNVIRVVGINSLSLAQWQGHVSAGTTFVSTNSADDVYNGSASADWAGGGVGADTLNGAAGQDTLLGGMGNDIIDGGNDADYIEGGSGNDSIIAGAGDDRVYGDSGNDTIQSGAGVDYIDAGVGDDAIVLEGANVGAGDEYIGGDGTDTIRLTGIADYRTFDFRNSIVSSIEQLEFFAGASSQTQVRLNWSQIGAGFSTNLHVIGSAPVWDEIRIELSSAGTYSFAGWTFTNWDNQDDLYVVGSSGDDVLTATATNDYFLGGDGNDIINGGDGHDRLRGGLGHDELYGGDGSDVLMVSAAELSAGDHFFGGDGNGDTLWLSGGEMDFRGITLTGMERLLFEGGFNSTAIFNHSDLGSKLPANTEITGYGGNFLVITMGISNTFTNQFFYAPYWTSTTRVIGTPGNDTINGGETIEHLLGEFGNDILYGNGGNDILDGGALNDFMAGGIGDDTYYVDVAGDNIFEFANEGYDIIYSSVSVGTALDVEELILTGSAQYGVGNAQNNIIRANNAANELQGLAGDDILYGGAGIDLLYGQDDNDELNGEDDNDALIGGAGNDLLDGGLGQDYMAGGVGDDSYYVDEAGDNPIEGVGEGNDIIYASISYAMTANVEEMHLSNSAPYGIGNNLNNIIYGNEAFNELQGLGGNDSLYGGGDFDLLYGQEGNDNLHGEADNDALVGGDGNDVLDGGGGGDYLLGGTGDDSYYVDSIGDYPIEDPGGGHDIIYASTSYTITANVEELILIDSALYANGNGENNILRGNALNNEIRGFGGADTIIGGGGTDLLYGGAAADRFVYENASDAAPANLDAIMDFQIGVDKIDLTDVRTGASDTFSFTTSGGNTFLHVDLGGNGSDDLLINIYQVTGVTAGDILWS
jgi:Ca2+-binding RTX toxin-like protein